MIEMLATVVVERFDQRGTHGYRVLAGERVVGEIDQVGRTVEQALGDQVRYVFGAALNVTLDQDQPRAHRTRWFWLRCPTASQATTPSAENIGRKNSIGWPFSDSRMVW